MATIKITFPTPTDNTSTSANLDILLYNGTVGNEVLFLTVLKNAINKSIVGGNIEITGIDVNDGTTYNFSAKARDEAGNLSAAFSPVTVHNVPAAAFVMATLANTTMSAGVTFVAGTPNQFQATANTQLLKFNSEKTGAFSMKMSIVDAFTKSIGFGVDNVNDNVTLGPNWEAYAFINETYGVKVGAGLVDPNVPTTVAIGATNYLRISRASAGANILLHYFNGTSESLIHTFASASGSTWLKAVLPTSNRRIYDLQIQ